MSVDSYTYGTVTGVQAKIGWVIPSRQPFGESTTPTIGQVENELDQVATEIHRAMEESGYTADTKAVIAAAAPRGATWLERINEAGACAAILQMFPTASDADSGSHPGSFWKGVFDKGIKALTGAALERMGYARSRDLSALLVSTSTLDSDGNEKKPLFTRDTFNYPSTTRPEDDDD